MCKRLAHDSGSFPPDDLLTGGRHHRTKGRDFDGDMIVNRAADRAHTCHILHNVPPPRQAVVYQNPWPAHPWDISTHRHGTLAPPCRVDGSRRPFPSGRPAFLRPAASASVAQAAMQGRSSQRKQGNWSAKITGVPSWMQHDRVMAGRLSRNRCTWYNARETALRSTAPGGRSQSVRMGGAGFSGAASTCATIFLRRLRDREDGILEKIAPTVFGIGGHQMANLR